MDPKTFYNTSMPEKYGPVYEQGRWDATPFLKAQYQMMNELLQKKVLPLVAGSMNILEVGPGPGTWTKKLLEAEPNAHYTLVDISSEMLGQSRSALAEHENIEFLESDFVEFQHAPTFNFFFSSRAIEYMPDKKLAVAKIASLLAAGGKGVLITKTPKPGFDRLRGRTISPLHRGQIGPSELARLVRDAGFVVDGVDIATATVPGLHAPLLNKLAYALLSRIPFVRPLFIFSESYLLRFHK